MILRSQGQKYSQFTCVHVCRRLRCCPTSLGNASKAVPKYTGNMMLPKTGCWEGFLSIPHIKNYTVQVP